jgi:UPF0755 protein
MGLPILLLFGSFGENGKIAVVTVNEGDTVSDIADALKDKGLIKSKTVFMLYAQILGKDREFKAGRYDIDLPISIASLIKIFSGNNGGLNDIEITIPEGSKIADIDAIFSRTGLTKNGDFLKPDILKLEGYLFPDTYRFSAQTSVEDIVKKMQSEFDRKVTSSPDRNTVIIASILEREVRSFEDMKLVAGIIKKRIDIGMALEIDATVAYGVCINKYMRGQECDTSLVNLVDNIPRDSDYNTYRRTGLPAGPISNPGIKAIDAALNPEISDYLYYLSAKDGTTIFSKTYQEHQKARREHIL